MARALGEGGGRAAVSAAEAVQHQVDDVALAPLQVVGVVELDAHRRARPCGRGSGETSRAR